MNDFFLKQSFGFSIESGALTSFGDSEWLQTLHFLSGTFLHLTALTCFSTFSGICLQISLGTSWQLLWYPYPEHSYKSQWLKHKRIIKWFSNWPCHILWCIFLCKPNPQQFCRYPHTCWTRKVKVKTSQWSVLTSSCRLANTWSWTWLRKPSDIWSPVRWLILSIINRINLAQSATSNLHWTRCRPSWIQSFCPRRIWSYIELSISCSTFC